MVTIVNKGRDETIVKLRGLAADVATAPTDVPNGSELFTMDDITEIAHMLKGAKRYFLQKFVDNKYCIRSGLHEVPFEKTKKYLEVLSKDIPETKLRGY